MEIDLGAWAVIDIETTGVDPLQDEIIDVGFIQFEGTEVVRTYQSLVRSEFEVGHFIQKLTGITNKMLAGAPMWSEVFNEVGDLYGHHLLAHNAGFEESFLGDHFKRISDGSDRETYEDSLYYLALLFPKNSSLKLEKFIYDWKIRESECHRGFEDSIDLLKVLLVATAITRMDTGWNQFIASTIRDQNLGNWWYAKFFHLSDEQLNQIASGIDFDLAAHLSMLLELEEQKGSDVQLEKKFSFEFSGSNIQNIYRSEDEIKSILPFYRYRESQEKLSLRVGQSFKNNVHALIQAPTGTGKTMGYMLPSALFALEQGKRILVSTGTKTLQEQAIEKDVPQLYKLLGVDTTELKVTRLIGSGNHLCELLFRQQSEEDGLLSVNRDFEENYAYAFYNAVFYYNSQCESEAPIVRSDLPYVLKKKIPSLANLEKDVAVDFRSCTGNHCPFKNECSYIQGLRKAKDADIIVGNHSLMFSWPKGIIRPEYVVVDEAHKIEHETTQAFSYEVTGENLESFAKQLAHLQGLGSLFYLLAQNEVEEGSSTGTINTLRAQALEAQQMLTDHLSPLSEKVELFFQKLPKYTDIYWNEVPMLKKERLGEEIGLGVLNHLESIKFILENFHQQLMPYQGRWEAKNLDSDQQISALTRFESFAATLEDYLIAMNSALTHETGRSHSLRFHKEYGYALTSAPIDPGRYVHDGLLETSSSVVFTSATLGNAVGNQGTKGVEWASGYLYLPAERRFKGVFSLPSPYDYKKNCRVFLCDDTKALWDPQFVSTVMKDIVALIKDLKGRSLLLFSAKSRFEQAREILIKEFEGQLPLFVQGMGHRVVEDFKESGQGVLLGMESFGEGIDVPGDALQFVFIDKVPDLRMDLVIQDRRDFYEANLGNEFVDYYLSHRTRSLHQKLGRVIRTEKDHGGVIIVDARTKRWKGKTMERVLSLMEPYQLERTSLTDACEKVRDFILGE